MCTKQQIFRCCNPFNIVYHRKSSVRLATNKQIEKLTNFPSPIWLCDGCRKKVDKCNIFQDQEAQSRLAPSDTRSEDRPLNNPNLVIETSESKTSESEDDVEYEPFAKKACTENVH